MLKFIFGLIDFFTENLDKVKFGVLLIEQLVASNCN